DYAAVESHVLYVCAGRRQLLGTENPETLASLECYDSVLYQTERFSEAERIASQILAIRERVLGPDAPGTIQALMNLAGPARYRGDQAQAERLLREALRRCQRTGTKSQDLYLVKELAAQRLFQ